jgi:hypothetical protein
LFDVTRIDLGKRRETLIVIGATVQAPIVGIGSRSESLLVTSAVIGRIDTEAGGGPFAGGGGFASSCWAAGVWPDASPINAAAAQTPAQAAMRSKVRDFLISFLS